MKKSEVIKEMNWVEFVELDDVAVDESPKGSGNALFYNDGNVQVSCDFDGEYDDISLYEDEALVEELKELAIEALEEHEEWEKLENKEYIADLGDYDLYLIEVDYDSKFAEVLIGWHENIRRPKGKQEQEKLLSISDWESIVHSIKEMDETDDGDVASDASMYVGRLLGI